MATSLSEYLTAQFYAWELRGRGWQVFDEPVHLEPEFIPFFGHKTRKTITNLDDGRRPRFFPKLQESLGLYKKPNSVLDNEGDILQSLDEIYPVSAYPYAGLGSVHEFRVNFDKDTRVSGETIEQLLLMLSSGDSITSFEVIGTKDTITIQFVCTTTDAKRVHSILAAYIPGVVIHSGQNYLSSLLPLNQCTHVVEIGLCYEFMRPIRTWNKFDPDPLTGSLACLECLSSGEMGMVQVLFQPTVNPWAESSYRSLVDSRGEPFFVNAPEMIPLAKEKFSSPLFSAVIRTVANATGEERAGQIAVDLAQSLKTFNRTGSNELIPLPGELSCDYEDLIERRSRRIGMLLSTNELASIAHIPDRSVISPKLRSYVRKSRIAPSEVQGNSFVLGVNLHLGQEIEVSLSDQQRLRHMHVIGATGTGKSTLLLSSIMEDINQGKGIIVLDPHGDLVDAVTARVPVERIQDVVLVDPSDTEYPIGLNLLSAKSDAERVILASDLVALFRRFATSWGDQMTSVLANAITTILESEKGGTLIDLRRMLVEAKFRDDFLETVDDPNLQYYWKNEFQLLRQNAVAPILTRLDTFLRPRTIRNMMAQQRGIDFTDILASKKILLVKLAQGLIGEENSYLLGTLFVAKIHQAAQARQNLPVDLRHPCYFYIDEFQNFITPSMAAILSGARKYGLGLILAHQDLEQLSRRDSELANSVLSNPAIRICFRCGDRDAVKLADGFANFDSTDLQSLTVGQAIARVSRKDQDFNLSFSQLLPIDDAVRERNQIAIVTHSREKYALHQSEVEDLISEALQIQTPKKHRTSKVEAGSVKAKPVSPSVEEPPRSNIDLKAKEFLDKEEERTKLREHRYLQEYIKKVAEARNFKAVVEESVNDRTGSVDVSISRDNLRIACEISVSNTVEYEVKNIEKCLRADYSLVFMLSNDAKHLADIRSSAIVQIPETHHKRIFFVSKEEFSAFLDDYVIKNQPEVESRVRGYRVKVNYTDSKDSISKEKSLRDALFSAIRRQEVDKEKDPE